nr:MULTISPECIES: hypothetical protein [unclassified Tolypothrix]
MIAPVSFVFSKVAPLRFAFATSAKQYAVSAKDRVESVDLEDEEDSEESVD